MTAVIIAVVLSLSWAGFVLFSPRFNYLDEHKKND